MRERLPWIGEWAEEYARKRGVVQLTAEQAIAAASQEGLTLVTAINATGFANVGKGKKRFFARGWRERKPVSLGTFKTAEQAALAVARDKHEHGETWVQIMTREQAIAQAKAEGLVLVTSDNATGFVNVAKCKNMFRAGVRREGK